MENNINESKQLHDGAAEVSKDESIVQQQSSKASVNRGAEDTLVLVTDIACVIFAFICFILAVLTLTNKHLQPTIKTYLVASSVPTLFSVFVIRLIIKVFTNISITLKEINRKLEK